MEIKITLVCAGGMSTSILVQKMQKAATEFYPNDTIHIVASAESKFKKLADETDILLLGPQVMYMKKKIEEQYADKGFPIVVINSVDYGMINGEKILNEAIHLVRK
ncbi:MULTISPECIES: PTS sugar transporter subunit IIB [Carnobacterium]|uniref:PTS sugar transporter subunit IIB n=1 Tax=Carnobacterium divergens TaxID=2748 RepID=A0A2R8A4Q3_CARDV|nr:MULTISPECIES: PTS sugar transporter subunit IIB [Carnobacterium]MCO6019045.1 PTS sugar transporter subunit IIB [Carnobacterium divergens]MDT1940719.1 PTS sugar transporter subunit IIB [Carnobacterium divergens]MDT1943157.1 PTS sugar transporter subunit IIB [Carnobacterium divergens]MDT1948964.1 PTS sugar transporter subunit IIB [Carnobacterium divergens]MDT1951445.1 PTS sugar transporter subunit IIB [Carnobacterium divergens]